MPYTDPRFRLEIDKAVDELVKSILVPGDLTYAMTRLWHRLLKNSSIRYVHLRDIVGDTVMAILELYRMIAAPYEDRKARENGLVGLLDIEGTQLGGPGFKIHEENDDPND